MNLMERIEQVAQNEVLIPEAVWDCPDLLPIDIKTYRLILSYSKLVEAIGGKMTRDGEPVVDISQATLAERTLSTITTIRNSLNRLVKVGLIKVKTFKSVNKNNNIMLSGDFFGFNEKTEKIESKKVHTLDSSSDSNVEEVVKVMTIEENSEQRAVAKRFQAEKYKEKLKSIGGKTREEREVVEISKHYDMLARKVLKTSGYRSLSVKQPQKHKNWTKFLSYREFCLENNFDPFVFLEVQFERAKTHWQSSKFKYPLPHMLKSKAAKDYFISWLDTQEKKYAKDVRKTRKLKAKKTESLKEQVMRGIVKSCENLHHHCNTGDEEERMEMKVLRLSDAWISYSSAYLYSVPWFHDYLEELVEDGNDHPRLTEVVEDFKLYGRNKKIREVIDTTVRMCEDQFNIPGNMEFEE